MLIYFNPTGNHFHECHVYDTLGKHDIDFKVFEGFGIPQNIEYKYIHVQQQPDLSSCGLYVIALAVDIAYSNNFENANYDMAQMRAHLYSCIY